MKTGKKPKVKTNYELLLDVFNLLNNITEFKVIINHTNEDIYIYKKTFSIYDIRLINVILNNYFKKGLLYCIGYDHNINEIYMQLWFA